ncbi:MAG: hypothetical protein ABWZ64_05845, partial [Xanthobacteraceae bacterium]
MNLSLVALALLTALNTTSLVWPTCRLISAIDADNSFVAFAALVTLIDASFEACTIPFARCEVRSDSVAVAFIVLALSFTVLRTVSTRVRKDEIAASIATTRDENDLLEPVITPADAHGRLSRLTRE